MNRRLARESLSEGMDILVMNRFSEVDTRINFSFNPNKPSEVKLTFYPNSPKEYVWTLPRKPFEHVLTGKPMFYKIGDDATGCLCWSLNEKYTLATLYSHQFAEWLEFRDESLEDLKYFFANVEYVSPRAKLAPEKASASV